MNNYFQKIVPEKIVLLDVYKSVTFGLGEKSLFVIRGSFLMAFLLIKRGSSFSFNKF